MQSRVADAVLSSEGANGRDNSRVDLNGRSLTNSTEIAGSRILLVVSKGSIVSQLPVTHVIQHDRHDGRRDNWLDIILHSAEV
jgi:hypothetical protein